MSTACRCGRQAQYELGCVQCSTECCPDCSVQIESVAYCAACAAAIVGTDVRAPRLLPT
jgi:hypothetical protein